MPVYRWSNYELTDDGKFQQKQFRGEIVAFLLQVADERPDNDSPPGPDLSIPTPVWLGCKGHYPQIVLLESVSCADKVQGSIRRSAKKTLHISMSFQLFHER